MSEKRVCAYIDLGVIAQNMDHMAATLGGNTRMIAVIKADGYGHGAVEIARTLSEKSYMFGFAVATVEEALELKNAGITLPILILGYTFAEDHETLIEHQIRPAVFKIETAKELQRLAEEKDLYDIPIHVKVDTDMSRIGVPCDEEGIEIVKEIAKCNRLVIEGVFTHFAKADEADLTEARFQYGRFEQFVKRLTEEQIKPRYCHCSNSASILDMQEARMDLVRAGITLYGLSPSKDVNIHKLHLKPALSLKSHIVYIKKLKKGKSVSYGGTYTAPKDCMIATIPVGYADGYPRSLSNKGYVLIHGKKAPIVGRICMDQFMVDVTDIPEAKEYDEVVLIGEMNGEVITTDEIGDLSGRFNYEFVCDLTKRVPRHYIR